MEPAPSRWRRLGFAVAVALLIAASTSAVAPSGAGATDPAEQVRVARAAAERAATAYFGAEQRVRDLDARIATLDARMAADARRAESTRAIATARIAALYRQGAAGALVGPTPGSLLEQSRRATLLDAANARSQADIDRYLGALDDLRREQADATRAREEARAEVTRLAARRAELDAQLLAVQRAYLAAVRARNAAALAAAAARTPPTRKEGRIVTAPTRAPASTTSGPTAAPGSTATSPPPPPPPSTNPPAPGPTDQPPPPPPSGGVHPRHDDPFLTCVRQRESRGFYGAVNPNGYYGAYQFATSTWNATASYAGRLALVGVRPDRASPWDQDDMAWTLYQWQGPAPWGGSC